MRRRPARTLRRAVAVAAAVLLGIAAAPAGADGPQPSLTLDPGGAAVAAYGGWSAWSRLDPLTRQWALVARSPQGSISPLAVPERQTSFDVELGPAAGGVDAVYSRCGEPVEQRGCHLVLLALGRPGASERTLAPPGGGSDHEPAIWGKRLVFLRRAAGGGSERPSGPGRRPDRLFAWSIGSRRLTALALPSSRGAPNSGAGAWPAGLTGLISGLTFNGRQVAYVTTNAHGSFGESTLWFEPVGRRPELIDQVTGGAGNACPPAFLSPVLSAPWLYAYLHACDASANKGLDRLTRYRHGRVQRARYVFVAAGDEDISSAVPDGGAVDWANEAGVQRVPTVSWRTIAAPVAQSFCGRADPFC